MSGQRQKQVAQVMYLAGQMPPGQRNAFLDRACAGDKELYREVASRLNPTTPNDHAALPWPSASLRCWLPSLP